MVSFVTEQYTCGDFARNTAIPYNSLMRAEVDQSGKVEKSQQDTVLAVANGIRFTIRISAREKRKVEQTLMRQKPYLTKRLIHVYVFSVLLYLLLRDRITHLDQVIIDPEYQGHEPIIKDRLMTWCRRRGIRVYADQIAFQHVGKKSPAHKAGVAVFRGEIKPDREISAEEVLAEL